MKIDIRPNDAIRDAKTGRVYRAVDGIVNVTDDKLLERMKRKGYKIVDDNISKDKNLESKDKNLESKDKEKEPKDKEKKVEDLGHNELKKYIKDNMEETPAGYTRMKKEELLEIALKIESENELEKE